MDSSQKPQGLDSGEAIRTGLHAWLPERPKFECKLDELLYEPDDFFSLRITSYGTLIRSLGTPRICVESTKDE